MRYRLAFVGIACCLAFVGYRWFRRSPPSLPPECRFFHRDGRAEIELADPAGRYQATQFVRLQSSDLVVPIFLVDRPSRRGFMGAVKIMKAWNEDLWYIGERQLFIDLPLGEDIQAYVWLVRRVEGDREWHVFEVRKDRVWGSQDPLIHVPKIEDLELLSSRPDAEAIISKLRGAIRVYERLGMWEDDARDE